MHRNNSGLLEAGGDGKLGPGEIEYVRKHSNQLVCACSEGAARDAVRAGSLTKVNTLNLLTSATEKESP